LTVAQLFLFPVMYDRHGFSSRKNGFVGIAKVWNYVQISYTHKIRTLFFSITFYQLPSCWDTKKNIIIWISSLDIILNQIILFCYFHVFELSSTSPTAVMV